ncbi:MAG TPA: hypothetical protein VFP80_09505, partial [Thermoanaerobaculia bacterium]|nr:hypothetical protein [Thermoanaerobaculia bacterium]
VKVLISDDIEKGVAWFESIVEQLQHAEAGVVCVTPENVDSPWLHFEAGALEQRLRSGLAADVEQPQHRLFPLLHGLAAAELRGPLGAYQATMTTEAEIERMIGSIARVVGGRKRSISRKRWNELKRALDRISVPVRELVPNLEALFQRKTFNEPLQRCVDQAWLRRYDGAQATLEQLRSHAARTGVCAPYERELFSMLVAELDAYAMGIHELLFTPKRFELGEEGELRLDPQVIACCEDRRLAVRSIAGRLLSPLDAPYRAEAVRFMAAETSQERKMIVHWVEGEIRKWEEPFKRAARTSKAWRAAFKALTNGVVVTRFRQSSWDLDRIYYYLLIQYFGTSPLHAGKPVQEDWLCAARDIEMEVERYRSKSKGGSLMPLTYALGALQSVGPRSGADAEAVQAVLSALDLVQEELGSIVNSAVARVLKDLRSRYAPSGRPRRPRPRPRSTVRSKKD